MIKISSEHFAIFAGDPNNNKDYHFVANMIQEINLSNLFLCIISVGGHFLLNRKIDFLSEIKTLKDAAVLKKYKFILIFESILEAPSFRHNLNSAVNSLSTQLDIPIKEIIIWSGAQNQFGDQIKNAPSLLMFGTELVYESSQANLMPDTYFISLSRIAKIHRVLTTIEIIKRKLKNKGLISLGSGYYQSPSENENGLKRIPAEYANMFPMFVDGYITTHHNNLNQYRATDHRFLKAFVNVVMETSYDRDINFNSSWNVAFLTEKSAKPFAWGQIPLVVSCRNTVQIIRDLGFDLFDDIIDHSYDSEEDPHTRIHLVVDQLENICQKSIEDWQQFKRSNLHRFESNRQLIIKYHKDLNRKITIENLKKEIF